MKTLRPSIVLVLVLGLFAAVPALAQTSGSSSAVDLANQPGSLALLVTINKLDLSQTQMQQIHDILAGILAKADAMKTDRDAFTQEMLVFDGTSDELDAALSAFQKKMDTARSALEDAVTQAVKEISGILTIEQGQILKQAFPGLTAGQALGAPWLGRMAAPAGTQAGSNSAAGTPQTPAQRMQNQQRTLQNGTPGQSCPMGFRADGQPAIRMQGGFGVMPRTCVRGQTGDMPGPRTASRLALRDGFAARRLSLLQEVVDILGAKLGTGS